MDDNVVVSTHRGRTYAVQEMTDGSLLVRVVGGGCQLAIETPDAHNVRLTTVAYPGETSYGDLSITLDAELLGDLIIRARRAKGFA